MKTRYKVLVVVFLFIPSWIMGKLPIDLMIFNPQLIQYTEIPALKWTIFLSAFTLSYLIGYACIIRFPYDSVLNIRRVIGGLVIGLFVRIWVKSITGWTFQHIWNITLLFKGSPFFGYVFEAISYNLFVALSLEVFGLIYTIYRVIKLSYFKRMKKAALSLP